jgi:acyl dehydratase
MTGPIGSFNPAMLVHGEQAVQLHRPLPVEGTLEAVARVAAIYDKGSAAVVVVETAASADGGPLFTLTSSLFIRGEGGFGGDRGPASVPFTPPERSADHSVTYTTRPEQALLYRLTGDRNPLHSDPAFASRGGFERPILHGLCTYGFTGRALLHSLCDGQPERFRLIAGRFSAPVFPGDQLTIEMWVNETQALFQTKRGDGTPVITGGRFTFSS